ncbi:hypothetical protein ABK040_014975 [Willaertia magna]
MVFRLNEKASRVAILFVFSCTFIGNAVILANSFMGNPLRVKGLETKEEKMKSLDRVMEIDSYDKLKKEIISSFRDFSVAPRPRQQQQQAKEEEGMNEQINNNSITPIEEDEDSYIIKIKK